MYLKHTLIPLGNSDDSQLIEPEKYLITTGNRAKGFKKHEGEQDQVNGVNCKFMLILQKYFVVLHGYRL